MVPEFPLDDIAALAKQDVATAILAPYIVGLCVQVLLIGVFLALFTAHYQSDIRTHSRAVKGISWTVFGLVLCCLGMSFEEIIDTCVSQKRSSDDLLAGPAQSNVLPVLIGLTNSVCQAYLMVRAARLITSKKLHIVFCAITSSLIALSLAFAILFSYIGFLVIFHPDSTDVPLSYGAVVALWLWSSAAADVCVTAGFACTLRNRIAGVYGRTDFILTRLIRLSLRIAAYTTFISIAGAAVSSALQGTNQSTSAFAFYLPLPALHAISLMTTVSSKRIVAAGLKSYDQEATKAPAGVSPGPPRTVRLGALSFPQSARAGESGGERNEVGFEGIQVKVEEMVRYEDDLDVDLGKARKAHEVAIDVV